MHKPTTFLQVPLLILFLMPHWVSAQDLSVRASWATKSDSLELLLPTTTKATRCLLVRDNLHILSNEESKDPFCDPELLLVKNLTLVALDRVTRHGSSFVLGICHEALQLPKEFVRISPLEEKVIRMPLPTKVQRDEILASILNDATNENKRHDTTWNKMAQHEIKYHKIKQHDTTQNETTQNEMTLAVNEIKQHEIKQ
jgi:hypothetical protein